MERDEQVTLPEYPVSSYDAHPPSDVPKKIPRHQESMIPCLDASGHFITANEARRITIAAQQSERILRKLDAAKFLDEAKLGLWDNAVAPPSFKLLKRSYDNQAFHFKDEKNDICI